LRSPNISKFVGTPLTTILLRIRIQIPRVRLAVHYRSPLTCCKENHQYRPPPQPHEKESTRYQPQFSPLLISSSQVSTPMSPTSSTPSSPRRHRSSLSPPHLLHLFQPRLSILPLINRRFQSLGQVLGLRRCAAEPILPHREVDAEFLRI